MPISSAVDEVAASQTIVPYHYGKDSRSRMIQHPSNRNDEMPLILG